MSASGFVHPAPGERPLFAVDSEIVGRCARLSLHGELDLATVADFAAALARAWAAAPEIRRLEIDLRGLTFIGSAGIAALLDAGVRARDRGCALTLVRGSEHVHRILELTGIAGQFEFRRTSARRAERGGALRIVS